MLEEVKRISIELIALSRYAREQRVAAVDPTALKFARETGILAPVVVRAIGNAAFPRYELLSGNQSWAIAQRLLIPNVPAMVLVGLSEAEARAYVEVQERIAGPLGRSDQSDANDDPLAWAEIAYEHIAEERKRGRIYSQKDAARMLGLDQTTLSHGLRMIGRLRSTARAALRKGSITLGHAKALTAFVGIEQDLMVERIVVLQASVRATEEAAAARREGRTAEISRGVYKRDIDLVRLEEHISAVTGIPSAIEYDLNKKAGRVILKFADLDAFDSILARLGVPAEAA
jgi:ParB family transcriptional regulator, chromosome partitioning protein